MIRVIFMGTPDYAEKILEALIKDEEVEVVSVYTQPDKPVGRKKILTAPVVKTLAQNHDIEVYQPNRLRDSEVVEGVLAQECDYIIVAAYGQILPLEVLEHAPCINLHASILPKYRGASPIQEAILHADKKTGVTAMLMNEGLDTGDIIKISEIDISEDEMVVSLFDRLTECAVGLTLDVVKNYADYKPKAQDDAEATHCKKITKADGEVAFIDAQELYNRYRAYTPWPGVYTNSSLKLKEMQLLEASSENSEGEILEIKDEGVVIGCKRGSLLISRVQPPSKKEISAHDYINGKRLNLADTLL